MPSQLKQGQTPGSHPAEHGPKNGCAKGTNVSPQASAQQGPRSPTSLSRIPKPLGFSIYPMDEDKEVIAASFESLLHDQWSIQGDVDSKGLVRLRHATEVAMELYIALGRHEPVQGKLPLEGLKSLHYHVIARQPVILELTHPFTLFERRFGSDECLICPKISSDIDFVIVGFNPQEWAVSHPHYSQCKDAALQLTKLRSRAKEGLVGGTKANSRWMGVTNWPVKCTITHSDGQSRTYKAERFIRVQPFTDEITMIEDEPIFSREFQTETFEPFLSGSEYARVFVLEQNKQLVYISMPVKEGMELPRVFTAVDPRYWNIWKIAKDSSEYKTFLDGEPCKEGFHLCKKEKNEPSA